LTMNLPHCINVRFVTCERLCSFTATDIPQLRRRIACTGDENILIRTERQTGPPSTSVHFSCNDGPQCIPHHVSSMITELNNTDSGFNVPKHTGHITGRSHNLTIIYESAARQVPRVSRKFACALVHAALFVVQVVDGTDIVKTTTSNKVSRRRVCACHNPGRPKRDRVHLVGCVSIPYDKLSVLRCRHKMALVRRPVHRVNLSKMTPEGATGTHYYTGERVDLSSHGAD
jgi:hypothetical protein